MKRTVLFTIMAISMALFLVACGKTECSKVEKKESVATEKSETWEPEKVSSDTAGEASAHEGHGHDHEGHGHDHGGQGHSH